MKERKSFPLGKTIFLRKRMEYHQATCNALIASGSNMLVYSANIDGNMCVLKELYPEGLVERNIIKREDKGRIKVQRNPYAWWLWLKACKRCIKAANLNMKLQRIPSLKQQITPLQGAYYSNGTIYLVISSIAGCALNLTSSLTVPEILAATICIARMADEIHRQGWLLIDIKASNFIINHNSKGKSEIRITDFDSAISVKRVCRQKCFMCSSETAPRELLCGVHDEVGYHSDVYSIAAMLLIALAHHPLPKSIHRLFDDRIYPRLTGWSNDSIHRLETTLEHALADDVRIRTTTCMQLADELSEICRKENIAYESIYA